MVADDFRQFLFRYLAVAAAVFVDQDYLVDAIVLIADQRVFRVDLENMGSFFFIQIAVVLKILADFFLLYSKLMPGLNEVCAEEDNEADLKRDDGESGCLGQGKIFFQCIQTISFTPEEKCQGEAECGQIDEVDSIAGCTPGIQDTFQDIGVIETEHGGADVKRQDDVCHAGCRAGRGP